MKRKYDVQIKNDGPLKKERTVHTPIIPAPQLARSAYGGMAAVGEEFEECGRVGQGFYHLL